MQKSLEDAFFAYAGSYQIPIYGMFSRERPPLAPLELAKYHLKKSSQPFYLEPPNGSQKYDCYVFDIELHELPDSWESFAFSIFKELEKLGANLSWLTFDPGFDFDVLFSEHFAQNVFAFCLYGANPIFAKDIDELRGDDWQEKVLKLKEQFAR